jgi:hypothetical protein
VEVCLSITPQLNYGNSSPLILGYSRGTRFKCILEKLFYPRLFGKPNARVLYNLSILPKDYFVNGHALLKWLAALSIPNKNYQCTHYYFIFITKPRKFPIPPHQLIIHKIEEDFVAIENAFQSWPKKYKSFFSYNWILRKILQKYSLDYFLQFVKPIKCKRRLKKYNTMYTEIMSEDNVVVTPGNWKSCQKSLGELPGGVSEYHQKLLFFSSLVTRKSHCTGAPS